MKARDDAAARPLELDSDIWVLEERFRSEP